jgi:hypothetical protein
MGRATESRMNQGPEARSNQGGSRRYLTNLSRYSGTLNLFAEWARKGRSLFQAYGEAERTDPSGNRYQRCAV